MKAVGRIKEGDSCAHFLKINFKLLILIVMFQQGLQDISCIGDCMGLLHLDISDNSLSDLSHLSG